MHHAFLSYSRINKEFAYELHGQLNARELDIWIDKEDIPPAVDWWSEIEIAIQDSDSFIAVVSPA